jgi:predicted glycosyltransferase
MQKTMAAADRLGITQYLQPDHITTSQAYRELAQAVKSVPGSEARSLEIQGLNEVGNRAATLVDELRRKL